MKTITLDGAVYEMAPRMAIDVFTAEELISDKTNNRKVLYGLGKIINDSIKSAGVKKPLWQRIFKYGRFVYGKGRIDLILKLSMSDINKCIEDVQELEGNKKKVVPEPKDANSEQ